MGKLGVIGGMGPEATAYFYEQVIEHTDASRDQEHLDMVIISQASMPDRTEAILTDDSARLLEVMRADAQALEGLGCTCIAIPCNTSHYFYDQIQGFTSVPIIHMPRETVREAVEARGARRVGVMGTDGTIQSGVYARECEAFGVECLTPSPERQADVMSIIYDDVKAGRPADMTRFRSVVDELEQRGCDTVVLACTELSVAASSGVSDICLDAMDVLVRKSILRTGKPYRRSAPSEQSSR